MSRTDFRSIINSNTLCDDRLSGTVLKKSCLQPCAATCALCKNNSRNSIVDFCEVSYILFFLAFVEKGVVEAGSLPGMGQKCSIDTNRRTGLSRMLE